MPLNPPKAHRKSFQLPPSKAHIIMAVATAFATAVILTIMAVTIYSDSNSSFENSQPLTTRIPRPMPDVRAFPRNTNGIEIPLRLVSITPLKGQTLFYVTIFVKIPQDLIDNENFLDHVTFDIEDNFVAAIERETKGMKLITADLQMRQKQYEEIINALYVIEFVKGSSTGQDFLTLYRTSFLDYVDEYYMLIDRYRYPDIHEVTTGDSLAYTVDGESDEVVGKGGDDERVGGRNEG
jgi:hypothetical protein